MFTRLPRSVPGEKNCLSIVAEVVANSANLASSAFGTAESPVVRIQRMMIIRCASQLLRTSSRPARSTLTRLRGATHICIPDVLNIPDELRITLSGRNAPIDDPRHAERWMLHCGMDGRLLIFCADTELAILRASEYLICDGTFEMVPDSAYQLYTVHGYNRGEGMALLWALLPNKATSTYVETIGAIRRALIDKFGDLGEIRRFLTDFEMAAINAIHEVFPHAVVKGYSFHFCQAILRRANQEGIQSHYNTDVAPEIHDWIRAIMVMTLLPAFATPGSTSDKSHRRRSTLPQLLR